MTRAAALSGWRPRSDREVLAVPHPGLGRPDDAVGLRAVALTLQPGHPGEQGLEADADEVGQRGVVTPGRARAADGLAWNPDDHRARRPLLDHDRVGADPT